MVGFVCRVIVFSTQIQTDFLLKWIGGLDTNWAMLLMKEMMSKDLSANLQLCIQVYITAILIIIEGHETVFNGV